MAVQKTVTAETKYSALIYDAGGGVTYYGFAEPGSTTSAAKWRIMKGDSSSNPTTYYYANGTANFIHVWDNYMNYTYDK